MNSGCADERGGIWLLHVHISGAVCTYLEYMKVRVRVNRAARQVVATACARLTQAGAANKWHPYRDTEIHRALAMRRWWRRGLRVFRLGRRLLPSGPRPAWRRRALAWLRRRGPSPFPW